MLKLISINLFWGFKNMKSDTINQHYPLNHLKLLSKLSPHLLDDFRNYINFKEYSPKTTIVTEGDTERIMYFIINGELSIQRSGLDLGIMHEGQHFGELCLVSGKPRAATIVSNSEVILAELNLQGYEKMISEESDLAIQFTQAIVSALSGQLLDMTDSFSLLLKQRSHPRRLQVNVKINGENKSVRTGAFIEDLLQPLSVPQLPLLLHPLGIPLFSVLQPVLQPMFKI
jgi:CRP-like cAMP-binding protein